MHAAALFALLSFVPAKAPTRVLVLDVAGAAVTKDEGGALRDTLASELSKRKKYEVLTSEDVRRVLDVEAQRQAAGCEGESSCLAEIGAALGADRVVYGNVARLGSTLVVSLSVVDPSDARAFGRDTFQAGSVEEVGRLMPEAAERLFGRASAGTGDGGAPVVTILGGVVTVIGLGATLGLGGTTFYFADALQNPEASADTKALALEHGPNLLVGTIASGVVLAIGAAVTIVGVVVE